VEQVWYLLKNRRCEGPFGLDDLKVQAQKGLLAPDDYVIGETNFIKGQMLYRRAAEILPRDSFRLSLSVPEAREVRGPARPDFDPEDPKNISHPNRVPTSPRIDLNENHSVFGEWFGQLNFANIAAFCLVVLGATWFFEVQQSERGRRQPAEYSGGTKLKSVPEVVRREVPAVRPAPPVEKLVPSERPTREVARPDRPRQRVVTPRVLNERLNERGLASENRTRRRRPQPAPSESDYNAGYPEERPLNENEDGEPLPFDRTPDFYDSQYQDANDGYEADPEMQLVPEAEDLYPEDVY
jgi:hypothetical protein